MTYQLELRGTQFAPPISVSMTMYSETAAGGDDLAAQHAERGGESFADVHFDNLFARSLPGDRSLDRSTRAVIGACFSSIPPVPVRAPQLVAQAAEVVELLGLPPKLVASPRFVAALGGNGLLPGMDPYATCYGGHQFGVWAGR